MRTQQLKQYRVDFGKGLYPNFLNNNHTSALTSWNCTLSQINLIFHFWINPSKYIDCKYFWYTYSYRYVRIYDFFHSTCLAWTALSYLCSVLLVEVALFLFCGKSSSERRYRNRKLLLRLTKWWHDNFQLRWTKSLMQHFLRNPSIKIGTF